VSADLDDTSRPYPGVVQTGAGAVVAVSASPGHVFSKSTQASIRLIAGIGVDGDAHAGATVQHRSRVAADPWQSNLRQIHLMHAELHDELGAAGFAVTPGSLGENITTRGVPLLTLPVGTILRIGDAVIAITGLRNPCYQLNEFAKGLMKALTPVDANGQLVRKAGVMGVVVASGTVAAGMPILVGLPPPPHLALDRV
jgi:MOSC domain-containing protein YiiM